MTKRSSIFLVVLGAALFCLGAGKGASPKLEEQLKGVWKLKSVTCNGVVVDISAAAYTLSFDGGKGEYVSKTGQCTQVEPELYTYVGDDKVTIKQGVRACAPNPCAADLPASECGKETNPQTPTFTAKVDGAGKTLTLSTDDPKAIDCTGPGQKKPAIFILER